MKKLLISALLVLWAGTAWAATENFTSGWTATGANVAITSGTKISWTNLVLNGKQGVSKDAGKSYPGDWDISADLRINSSSQADYVPAVLALGDTAGDGASISVYAGESASGKVYIEVSWIEFTNFEGDAASNSNTLLLDTTYHLRFKRDDDGGISNKGRVSVAVYASPENRAAESSPLVSLYVDMVTQYDMDTVTVASTYDDGQTAQHTGYLENLDLAYVPSTPSTRKVTIIDE